MTLGDVTLPVDVEWGRDHALLFSAAIAERLAELHAEYGRADCVPLPRVLVDGRCMFTADILLAVEPGGPLHEMWQHADMSVLLPAVEVVPIADAVALLPPDPPV